MGLSPELVATVDIEFIEINESALAFVKDRMDELQGKWDVRFKNVRFLNQDFRDVAFKRSRKPRVFFGNPPFVTNGRGVSRWKNLFADFLEISLQVAGPRGAVQYILPFSIAFSRDYQDLRDILRGRPSKIRLSHFDNIPDTLFKFGKPLHSNTNKANSQRCTILSVVPGENLSISSTPLLRWTKAERSTILGRSPLYYDVTAYGFDDQIPRPCDERILQYLEQSLEAPRLRNLMDKKGRHSVFVANVARNFIGIRDKPGTGTHDLRFRVRDDAHKALAVISSDLFFHYWLSIGDGFHVTKSNLLDFPIHPALQKMLAGRLPALRKTWRKRKSYLKTKLNSGRETRSYDFSGSFDSLYLSRPYLKG